MGFALPPKLARPLNYSSASFRITAFNTLTEPVSAATATATSAYVHHLGKRGADVPAEVLIHPFGTGANNTTGSLRILAWYLCGSGTTSTQFWKAVPLAEIAFTLGASVGIAGAAQVAADRDADTITLTTGNANISIDLNSPADDTIASALVTLKGANKVEFDFKVGTATDVNAWIAFVG